MRINQYLASCGLGSRRHVEQLILSKKVEINGMIAQLGDQIFDTDLVKINGYLVQPESHQYYLFFKPIQVLTTLDDPFKRTTIKKYFQDISYRVFPVGRLDFDTQGLLILTNDGFLAHQLAHPRYEIEKEYIVKTNRFLSLKEQKIFKSGIILPEGKTKSCHLSVLNQERQYKVILTQGWNRQIKRMFQYFGIQVLSLKRIRIANLKLGNLKEGQYRPMTLVELKELQLKLLNYKKID